MDDNSKDTSYYLDQLNGSSENGSGADDSSLMLNSSSMDGSAVAAAANASNPNTTPFQRMKQPLRISTSIRSLVQSSSSPSSTNRRVSSLVRVLPLDDPETQQSCVIPMMQPGNKNTPSSLFNNDASIDEILKSPEHDYRSQRKANGLVLVTPNVIGTAIRPHITLETARLVSQVAHLETEDWARQYNQFDGIEWVQKQSKQQKDDLLKQVARDMAQFSSTDTSMNDSSSSQQQRQKHGVVLSMGEGHEKLLSLWMREVFATLQDDAPPPRLPMSPGSNAEEAQCVTLSMLEIGNDKDMVDLLLDNDTKDSPLLRVHHPDRHGGMVVNLTRAFVDNDKNMELLLKRGLRSIKSDRIIVATLTIWPSAVDEKLNRLTKCRYLQFVHLPSSGAAVSTTTTAAPKRSTISLRQSLSSLGGILRHFVSDTDNLCSFRDCTLTKVLQRSLEPQSTQIVVMGTVSTNSEQYERTVHTLNYMQQLFVGSNKSTKTPNYTSVQSPFDAKSPDPIFTSALAPEDLGKHPAFLGSKVADPRQRIANLEKKLLRSAASSKRSLLTSSPLDTTKEEEEEEELFQSPTKQSLDITREEEASPAYQPTNYMDLDPLDFQSDYYKDEEKADDDPVVSISPLRRKHIDDDGPISSKSPISYRKKNDDIIISMANDLGISPIRADPPIDDPHPIDRADPPETGFPFMNGTALFSLPRDANSLDYSFHDNDEHGAEVPMSTLLQQLKSPLENFIGKQNAPKLDDGNWFEGEDILQETHELQYSHTSTRDEWPTTGDLVDGPLEWTRMEAPNRDLSPKPLNDTAPREEPEEELQYARPIIEERTEASRTVEQINTIRKEEWTRTEQQVELQYGNNETPPQWKDDKIGQIKDVKEEIRREWTRPDERINDEKWMPADPEEDIQYKQIKDEKELIDPEEDLQYGRLNDEKAYREWKPADPEEDIQYGQIKDEKARHEWTEEDHQYGQIDNEETHREQPRLDYEEDLQHGRADHEKYLQYGQISDENSRKNEANNSQRTRPYEEEKLDYGQSKDKVARKDEADREWIPTEPTMVSNDTTPNMTKEFLRSSPPRSKPPPTPPSSFRPPTYRRADSKISVLTADTDEAGGPLVTTPGIPSSVILQSALQKAKSPAFYQEQNDPQQLAAAAVNPFHNGGRSREISFADMSGSDAGFIPDFLELQEAVEELRLNNSASWKQKYRSLQRLQQQMMRKHTMHQKTVDELNEVEGQVRGIEREYKDILDERDFEVERERKAVEKLKKELEEATSKNSSYETVADKVASTIERLNQEVNSLRVDLSKAEIVAETRLHEFQMVSEVKEKLADELKGIRNQASDLSMEQTESSALLADLQLKVKQLSSERDQLKEQRDKDLTDMDELRLEIDNIDDAESRLQAKEQEIERLKQTHQNLSATVFEQKKSLSSEVHKREAEVETVQLKVQTISMELKSAKRRLEDDSGDQRRFRDAVEEELSSLREKIKQVQGERDQLQDLRDTDLSEMESLKLEAAIRKDLDKRLKAAGAEIDRLRAERGKVHEHVAAVRAEAASRVDEKDSSMQQLKLELHQARIEATSLRRRLSDVDEEYERTRKMYEEENQRFAIKLAAASDELSSLRSELAGSVRTATAKTNEASELSVALKAGEEEVRTLTSQLERLKIDQMGIKDENKKLRESLYELRDKARAQVMGIAEKKRENDALLEVERERTTMLETENAHLSEALEKARREQEVDKDGLDTFREDLNKLMKEKSEALTKSAQLEKQLKENEMTTEDLRHELELSKMRSNDDLLRKAKEEYRTVHASNVRLSEEVASLETERNVLNEDIVTIRQDMEKSQQFKATAETKAARLETMCQQSKHAIEDLQHKLEIASLRSNDELLKKAREENRAHQKLEAELRAALEQLEVERDESDKILQERTDDLEKLVGKKKELEEHVSTLASKLRITVHTAEELKDRLASTEKQKKLWEQTSEELRSGLQTTEQTRREWEHTTETLRYQLETTEKQRRELEKDRRELEKTTIILRNELEASESKTLDLERASSEEIQHLRETGRVENERIVKAMEQEINGSRAESERTIRALEEEVQTTRSENERKMRLMDQELENTRIEKEKIVKSLEQQLEARRIESERNVHTIEKEIETRLVERERTVERAVKAMEHEIKSLHNELSNRSAAVESLREELSSQSVAAESLRKEVSSRDAAIVSLREELSNRDAAIESLREELTNRDATAESLRKELSNQDTNTESLQEELSNQYANARSLREELSDQTAAVDSFREELSNQTATTESLRVELASQTATAESLRDELASRTATAESLREQLSRRTLAAESLQEQLSIRTVAAESLREQLTNRTAANEEEYSMTAAQYRSEQDRNTQMEELITSLANRSKATLELRERKIRTLRSNLAQLSEQKEAEIQVLRARLHNWERSVVREHAEEDYHWKSDTQYY